MSDAISDSPMWQAHLADQEAERQKRGKPLGLTADEVAAAESMGMALGDYARSKNRGRAVPSWEAQAADRDAREQAERQRRVEQARQALDVESS
jgi:hypothetical protein